MSTRQRGASMEPRPSERGNSANILHAYTLLRASMEPRPSERGNALARIDVVKGWRLQWSHVLPNVETSESTYKREQRLKASMEPRPSERGNIHLPRRRI